MQNLPLVTSLVGAFGLALVFGYLAERYFRMPALVGYLLSGVFVQFFPWLPPVDRSVTEQLAEVGVMLLMVGVGLHFSVRDLLAVKGVALPGALLQMLLIILLGALFAWGFWDWGAGSATLFGLTLSCASTVVVTKALEMAKLTNAPEGRVAMGWLIVQDLVTVIILVLLPPFASVMLSSGSIDGRAIVGNVLSTLAGVALFAFLMLGGGRRLIPFILKRVAMTGSRELFTLAVLALALGIAYAAGVFFNVSYALGAFLAGMVMRESRYAKRAATNALPLQDAFSVLFFVSVGMMLDWHIFMEDPYEILLIVAIILCGTTSVSFGLVLLLRWPLKTAFTVAASLAQIGEFSYIVAGQGIALGLADSKVMSLIVGASILTIALNPFVFRLIPLLTNRFVVRWSWARHAASRAIPTIGHDEEPATAKPLRRGGEAIVIGMDERVPGGGRKPHRAQVPGGAHFARARVRLRRRSFARDDRVPHGRSDRPDAPRAGAHHVGLGPRRDGRVRREEPPHRKACVGPQSGPSRRHPHRTFRQRRGLCGPFERHGRQRHDCDELLPGGRRRGRGGKAEETQDGRPRRGR